MDHMQQHHDSAYAEAKRQLEYLVAGPKGQYKEFVVNRDPNPADPLENSSSGVNTKRINMTQSNLRTRNKLDPNITNYTFGILNTEPSSVPAVQSAQNGILNPLELRLIQQDVFFVYAMGFRLYMISTPGGNTSFQYQPLTFPNPIVYGGVGINLDLMWQIWTGGNLNVTVNKNILNTNVSLMDYFNINQTQIPPINSNPPVGDAPLFNQINLRSDGIVTVKPNWILNGANQNLFQINYPNQLNNIGLGVSSSEWHIELFMKGFLAQNASSIMNNRPGF